MMFFGPGHLEARKEIFLSIQQVMAQETFDKRFDQRIFKKTNSSST
jgi:hypothetical protein